MKQGSANEATNVVEFMKAATARLRQVGGLQAVGIFRKPGSHADVSSIVAQLEAGTSPATALQSSSDPFVLASVLTNFLKADGERAGLAVGGTVSLLHPPLHLVGVSMETMRECQQNDSLADG